MKKVLALALAAVMVMALCGVAFATDPTYSITINNTATNVSIVDKTYYAYKLFDLIYSGSNYSYSIDSDGDGAWAWDTIKGTADTNGVYTNATFGLTFEPSAADNTVYYITSSNTMTTANARALADALNAVLPSTANGSVKATAETGNVIALTEPGYYVVAGTAAAKDDSTQVATSALALVSADPTATVNPKVEVPPLNKKITGEHVLDAAGNAATAMVGQTVSFELDSNVPDLNGYSDYTYTISDTMSAGLSFTGTDTADEINGLAVTIDGTELVLNGTGENANKSYTISHTVGTKTFSLTIPFATLSAFDKDDPIVVTYSAVLNSAALTTNYEKNTAHLTYSNNPYDDTTSNTPDDTVFVIDVDINVDKIAGSDTTAKLSGAKFKVFKGATEPGETELKWYKWDSTNNVVTWVAKANADVFETNNAGKFVPAVQGLEAEKTGTAYGLLEIEAPTGYNVLSAPVIVTLTGAYSESSGTKTATITCSSNASMTNGTITLTNDANTNQPEAVAQISNNSGTELPSTGGIGTTIFYISGMIMVLGAAIILVARRRADAE